MSNQEYQPIYGIYKNQDVMIPMRDGVRMNLNVLKMGGIKAHKSAASSSGPPFFERAVEMRYWGQSFELNLPTPNIKIVNDVWLNELIEIVN